MHVAFWNYKSLYIGFIFFSSCFDFLLMNRSNGRTIVKNVLGEWRRNMEIYNYNLGKK